MYEGEVTELTPEETEAPGDLLVPLRPLFCSGRLAGIHRKLADSREDHLSAAYRPQDNHVEVPA